MVPADEQIEEVEVSARALTRLGYRSEQHAQRHFDRATKHMKRNRLRIHEDEIMSDIHCQMALKCGISLREQELSHAIQERLTLMAGQFRDQTVSRATLFDIFNELAEQHGYSYGIPIPPLDDMTRPLVLAPGVPMRNIFEINQEHTEMEQELHRLKISVRNSWKVLGDQTVCIVDTSDGPMAWPRWDAGHRLRKLLDTTITRSASHVSAEAELRAMDSLKTRINEGQWASYVLNGNFGEVSRRSGLHYIFRKGYPALAISFHGKHANNGKVLCALCLHPMGYYQFTFAGLMTPTDEVIAQLLMMRSDEHKFWAKSGQWDVTDTRSGV